MSDVREFTSIKGDRKEPCAYCGHDPHPVPLACPRIKSITIYEGADCMEIEFHAPESPEAA